MISYSFEIVRRGFDRFAWVFVEVVGGRRRVLARSDDDFRSRKRARKAVLRLQEAVTDAAIIDTTGDADPFDLPATSFELAPSALPLVVGTPSSVLQPNGGHRRRRSRDRSKRTATPSVDEAHEDQPADDRAGSDTEPTPSRRRPRAVTGAPAKAASTGRSTATPRTRRR